MIQNLTCFQNALKILLLQQKYTGTSQPFCFVHEKQIVSNLFCFKISSLAAFNTVGSVGIIPRLGCNPGLQLYKVKMFQKVQRYLHGVNV